MLEYRGLKLSSLLDMLSWHTAVYTKMLADKTHTVDEITQCEQTIRLIQEAIEFTKKTQQRAATHTRR